MGANNDYISIAIPVFNETNGLANLVEKVVKLPFKKELLIIDDGSTYSETKKILNAIKKDYPQVTIIVNRENLGKSISIQLAFKKAKGNLFAILDGDSELDPNDILRLYKDLKKENARFANGSRAPTQTKQISYSRLLTALGMKASGLLTKALYNIHVKDILSGLKLFYADDFRNHEFATKRFGLESELVITALNSGRKFAEADVHYYPRGYKQGKKINILDSFEIIRYVFANAFINRNFLRSPIFSILLGIVILLFTFFVYNLHANSSATSDSIPNNFTTVNIIYHNRLDLENFRSYFLKKNQGSVVTENANNILYSKTPVINGILAAPYFYLFDKIHNIQKISAVDFLHKDYETYYQSVGKYYAALLSSFSVLFIYLTLISLFKNSIYAGIASLTYAFATSVYSTAALGNWQHAPSLLLINSAYYFLFNFLKTKRKSLLFIVSILLALAALVRITNLFFFLGIIGVLFFYKPYRKLLNIPIIVFLTLILLWQSITIFIGIPGGYNQEIIRSIQLFSPLNIGAAFGSLLISPNVGILIFCPIAIFGFLGIYATIRSHLKNNNKTNPLFVFMIISSINFALLLMFNSFWWAWEGGFSWGPRLLTEGIPFLIYLGAFYFFTLRSIPLKKISYIAFSLLISWSIFVQVLGVYAYDGGWHRKYYRGRSGLEMAWFIQPNIISYYAGRKVFFTQSIIASGNRLKIQKTQYHINFTPPTYKQIGKKSFFL